MANHPLCKLYSFQQYVVHVRISIEVSVSLTEQYEAVVANSSLFMDLHDYFLKRHVLVCLSLLRPIAPIRACLQITPHENLICNFSHSRHEIMIVYLVVHTRTETSTGTILNYPHSWHSSIAKLEN
jgi:hypothetical protein